MVGLCLGLYYAQRPEISASKNASEAIASPQSTATPTPNGQIAPAPQPASSPASAASGLQLSSGLNSLQGLKVAMIQVNGPGIDDAENLLTILPQKVNESLDRYKVRQSVQALYNTGRFAEIQVEAQRNPAGEVVLTFDARENYFFGSILAEGSSAHPSDSQLVNASKLNLGEQYTDEKITAGIEGMQRTLQENGYYQATIKPYYDLH
jgi:outer membrane protein assembly factor BamA